MKKSKLDAVLNSGCDNTDCSLALLQDMLDADKAISAYELYQDGSTTSIHGVIVSLHTSEYAAISYKVHGECERFELFDDYLSLCGGVPFVGDVGECYSELSRRGVDLVIPAY